MSIFDLTETFKLTRKKCNALICIYDRAGYAMESEINHMMAELFDSLKTELDDYEEINIAYVFETAGLMNLTSWEPLTKNTIPYYKEPCRNRDVHNLEHVFFMGMKMFQELQKEREDEEYRFYLITDEAFERTSPVVWETEDDLRMNPAFEDVNAQFFLYKSANAGGGLLEEYIADPRHGEVKVF